MTVQFTPGPWKVSHDEFAGHYDVSTFDPERGSEAIAQVLYANNEPGGRGEADARLIAAAPALLLELEMTVDLLERASRTLTEECKSALDGKQWGGVRIASARAAIAFANGEGA